MFLTNESPLSMDLWLRSFGLSSLSSFDNLSVDQSEDVLVPPYDADSRRGSSLTNKMVLVYVLVGNGCLGLPLAFYKCGIALTIFIVIVLAILTARTLDLLWICSRKSGSNTFGGVVRVSFGHRAHWMSSVFLFVYLLLMLVNYMMAARDVWVPIVQRYLLPDASPFLIMFWMQFALIPCYWQHNLHYLWLPVWIGLLSLIASFVILCYKANTYHLEMRDLKSLPDTLDDSVSGLNHMLLHTAASFNILYLQAGLRSPSQRRMRNVVRHGIFAAAVIAVAIGLAGSRLFMASGEVVDNFLDHPYLADNMTAHPALHVATGLAIYLAMPLILIPCRDNLLEMVETLVLNGECPDISDCDEIETLATRASSQSGNQFVLVDETSQLLPSIEEDMHCHLNLNPWAHHGSLVGIILIAILLTLTNDLIVNIWKILSPSMTIAVVFILPAACYLEIHKRQTQALKTFSRWVIIFSIVFSFIGTIEAIRDVFAH